MDMELLSVVEFCVCDVTETTGPDPEKRPLVTHVPKRLTVV